MLLIKGKRRRILLRGVYTCYFDYLYTEQPKGASVEVLLIDTYMILQASSAVSYCKARLLDKLIHP